jgi:hypothetical protein
VTRPTYRAFLFDAVPRVTGWFGTGHTRGPARYQGHLAVGLSEDHARAIKDELTKEYIAKE